MPDNTYLLRSLLEEARAWEVHNGRDTTRHDTALRELAHPSGRYIEVKPVRDAFASSPSAFRCYYAGLVSEALAELATDGAVSKATLANLRRRLKRYGLD